MTGIPPEEVAELEGYADEGDHDSVYQGIRRHFGPKIEAFLRSQQPNRKGKPDAKKPARDLVKAQFKGLFDYFEKHRGMDRADAFHHALERYPLAENVAWDIAIGRRGEITRLSKIIENPFLDQLREAELQISKSVVRFRK